MLNFMLAYSGDDEMVSAILRSQSMKKRIEITSH
jgi:hypothetical protein